MPKTAHRLVIALYFLATVFLTAAVTHCWTRYAIAERQKINSENLVREMHHEPVDLRSSNIKHPIMTMRNDAPCLLAILLAVPGLTCLFGAITSHLTLTRNRPLRIWAKALEMLVVFIVLLFLAGLAIPC